MTRPPQTPFALLDLDSLLTEEERAIRDVVAEYVAAHIRPSQGQGCPRCPHPRPCRQRPVQLAPRRE